MKIDPTRAAVEGVPAAQFSPEPVDPYGAVANLASLMAMAHWHFLDGMRRVDDPAGSYYRMDRAIADQGLSLLYVADKYGADMLDVMRGEMEERIALRERGADL